MLYLTKTLSLLLYPLTLGLGLAVTGLVLTRWRRRAGIVVAAVGVGTLWLASTPLVGERCLRVLEAQHPPQPLAQVDTADAVVVLGGTIGAALPPRQHPDLHAASDRVWHAARLYHAGKAPVIVASGGRLPWSRWTQSEAAVMREVLASWGIPRDAVILETQSATTRENAVYSAELLRQRGVDRILLVTSAAHLPRALGAFRAALDGSGIAVVPAPTDVRVTDPTSWRLTPSIEALDFTTIAIHERVGAVVYRLRGWMAPESQHADQP